MKLTIMPTKLALLFLAAYSLWAQDATLPTCAGGNPPPSAPCKPVSAKLQDAPPPVVSDALQRDAYKALSRVQLLQLQQAQIAAQLPDAQKALEQAQAALMGACGANFQMDQEALKQEKFVCVAKSEPPKKDPAKPAKE